MDKIFSDTLVELEKLCIQNDSLNHNSRKYILQMLEILGTKNFSSTLCCNIPVMLWEIAVMQIFLTSLDLALAAS